MLLKPFFWAQSPADRIVIVQLVASIALATISLFVDWAAVYSSLLGSLVTILPGFVFGQAIYGRGRFSLRNMGQWKIGQWKPAQWKRVRSIFGSLRQSSKDEGLSSQSLFGEKGLKAVVRGIAAKFILSVVMFIAIFVLVPRLNALFFFGSFVGMQLLYAIVPLIEVNAGTLFLSRKARIQSNEAGSK